MTETIRYILAGTLIFLIILLQPIYLDWLGYDTQYSTLDPDKSLYDNNQLFDEPVLRPPSVLSFDNNEVLTTIITPMYVATLSNRSGGSLVSYKMKNLKLIDNKFTGGYNKEGLFLPNIPTSLILFSDDSCMPCLAIYDESLDEQTYINQPFVIASDNISDSIYVGINDSIKIVYELKDRGGLSIKKSVQFFGGSYYSNHLFEIEGSASLPVGAELLWSGGLRPTEKRESEDVQYGSASTGQANEVDNIFMGDPEDPINREVFNGTTDWVSIRTKYFTSAIIMDVPGKYAALGAKNSSFGNRGHTPAYNAAIGLSSNFNSISAKLYVGPLDSERLSSLGRNLDDTMDWGFFIIKPISKGVLWILKFAHETFKLNYGIVLLLFAVAVRLITGPLTKKSFESSQNMQKVQPELKKIQKKYKSDPTSLNKETMALYKKHGVNPLGGCLPILLQMPLLFALFQVFQSTIEFRGAPFIFWITDLSKPDVIWSPDFLKNIWGLSYFFSEGVAVLPFIMGTTLMLTMRMTSATMDASQKPIMYTMNVFFVLLFNTFPSGLNVYYTAYNILSFFQQRNIRAALENK